MHAVDLAGRLWDMFMLHQNKSNIQQVQNRLKWWSDADSCYWVTLTFDLAFRSAKVRSKSRLKSTRKPSYRWQTRATRKPAEIASIRRAYNVVVDNTGLSSCV